MDRCDVIVVGGGAIGCAVAWRAAARGLEVTLLERERCGAGATRVAAGMLAPITEVEFGEAGRRLLELGVASAALWPAFATELEAASGLRSTLRDGGTIVLARDGDEAAALERALDYRHELGLDVRSLRPSEARALEPAIAPGLRAALEIPSERSVDPRAMLDALLSAGAAAGVRLREHAPVAELTCEGSRVSGVRLANGERIASANIVLAAGAWSGAFGAGVRPVKGQVLRLRDPHGAGLIERVVRFDGGYVVPRGDGRYVLGASVEERGFDSSLTLGPLYELLRDAGELLPGLLELELTEHSAGLRPGSADNLPLIGREQALEGLIWATGHYRNGILLTPITAELVLGALEGAPPHESVDPARARAVAPAMVGS